MFLVCPSCKKVSISWDDDNIEFGNLVVRTMLMSNLPCRECFADRKIINGEPPATCKHGRPFNCKCRECIDAEGLQTNGGYTFSV